MLGIASVAFALRLVHIFQLREHPWFADPQVDALFHHDWALAIARGERFVDGPYFRAPLYPWFLGGLYKVFGPDPMAVRVVQALFGSASCVLVYLLGRTAFSDRVGRLAGLVAAGYWPLIYFDAELLIPSLGIFLNLSSLWLLLRAASRNAVRDWALAGAVCGLAALARPNILLFAPAAAAWIAVRAGLGRPAWRSALAYAAGCALLVLPVTARNWIVGGDRVLISSQAGVNLYIGNNPTADGVTVVGEFESWYAAQHEEAERAEGRELKPSEVSRHFTGRVLEFWAEQPGAALRLFANKLLHFWTYWEISNNQNPRFVAERYTPVAAFLPVGFWLVGPLGLLGWLAGTRRAREQFPLWGFVLVYTLSVVLFFVNARFRLPVVPVLIVYASAGVFAFAGVIARREWKSLALVLLAAIPIGWATAQVPATADTRLIGAHRAMGLHAFARGDFASSRELLEEAVRRAEAAGLQIDSLSWSTLGRARVGLDDLAGAGAAFERAVALAPNNADGQIGLAALYDRIGRGADALHHASIAVRLDERWLSEALRYGSNAWMRSAREEAGAFLREASESRPGNAAIPALWAQLLTKGTDVTDEALAQAVALAERAVQLAPDDPYTLLSGAYVHRARGNEARARELATTGLERARASGSTELATALESLLASLDSP